MHTTDDQTRLANLGLSDRSDLIDLMDASPDCIKIIDRSGSLAFMNEGGMCNMEIANFDTVEGMRWSDLWPGEIQSIIEDAVDRAFQGEPVRLEAFCPTALGRPRWWDVTVSPLQQDGGTTLLLSISRDITDRVRREQRAEERERQAIEELRRAKRRLGETAHDSVEPMHRVGPEAEREAAEAANDDAHRTEMRRVDELRRMAVLDTPPNPVLDRLTRLATRITGAASSAVSLVDADRQWFKAQTGLDMCETSRDVSFCSIAIRTPEYPFIVTDASTDPRTRDNPLVTGEPKIRAYAGIPLVTSTGQAIGSFCVIDSKARAFSDEDMEALRTLADAAQAELEREAFSKRATRLELISAEMRHRMGNTYAQVASLVGVLAKTSPDKDSLARALRENITALSRTQARITQGEWVSLDLCSLLDEVLDTSNPETRIDCDISPNLDIAPNAAFLMTLSLQELATNSRKHGRLREADGNAKLTLTSDEHCLVLEWQEQSPPRDDLDVQTPSTGFGRQLLTRIVPLGLGGSASLEIADGEMRYRLEVPLSRIAA